MMPFALLVLVRLAVSAFFLLTCAYAVLNCSPFAFDMFIKPQLIPWLTRFVAWHHVWFAVAYVASVAALAPALASRARHGSARAAHWLALGYVVSMGLTAAALLVSPFLPTLWNDGRALPTALASLVPLVWLAVIDHLASHEAILAGESETALTTGHRRLLVACGGTALYVWVVHVIRAFVHGAEQGSGLAWTLTAIWALVLAAAVFSFVFAMLAVATAIAARTGAPRRLEFSLIVALMAAGLCELFKRAVLPTLSLAAGDSAVLGAAAGATLALTWSGLMLRRPARVDAPRTAAEILLAPASSQKSTAFAFIALAVFSFVTLNAIERLDWNFVGQRLIVTVECLLALALMMRATQGVRDGEGSMRAVFVAPLVALIAIVAVPPGAARLAAWTGNRSLEPEAAFERYAAGEIAFRLMADVVVARSGFDDADYHRFLKERAAGTGRISVPDVEFAAPIVRAADRRDPDIFVFVIDSLRRDYLSPYNPDVSFTPNIARFADENFVFKNVFTRHGGTELAMASIWSGATVVRKVRASQFERMNALEKLVNANGYRIAINDFTVAEHLRAATPKTTIDPGVPSVDTDLCQNLRSLERHLDESGTDPRPVFGYFAPMNVHILNTQRGGQTSLDGDYPGFYAPYASRLKRLDGCFQQFIAYLKARNRYDDSIIVLTSDHGDSLGEEGHWGHAMWLFPEDVRIPLIVKIPEAMKARVTTDLARVAFSTDIAPTLHALLDRPVLDLGPLFGAPLFVPAGASMLDRRRESFLLTSSYGATFGLLRRNGRFLYVSDLVEWRESAYDLSTGPLGASMVVDSALRRVNQRRIREQVTEVAELYESR
jgi:Sulfatase